MAQDGLFTKLHLSVTARTRPGQAVLVSGSATADRTAGALEMVTSPDEWPVWRTPKPVIIPQGARHDYRYLLKGGESLEPEPEPGVARRVVGEGPELRVADVFGQTPAPPSSARKPSPPPPPSRLVIVCYHLPVRVVRGVSGAWEASWGTSIIAKSPGGTSIADARETLWVGTIHGGLDRRQLTEADKAEIRAALAPMRCVPLFSMHASKGYLNYAKRVLWPSFHNVTVLDQCCAAWNDEGADTWDQERSGASWDAYEALNGEFRDALLPILRAGDTVWVHDYHLMLLPTMLAEAEMFRVDAFTTRKARIVFFLHIPFPTSQLFCSLANGPKLLAGVVGADVVGFHAFEHARHFLNACTRLLGMPQKSVAGGITGVEHGGRTVMVVVRHVSVETLVIEDALKGDAVAAAAASLERDVIAPPSRETPNDAARLVLASVDACQRLSGVALKLLAYERFLTEYPRWRGRVALVQYCLLDKTRVADEERTSREVRDLVERVNDQHPGSISYVERPSGRLSMEERLALFQRADVLLGTAIREGHSLYPFEYALARARGRRGPGVTVASEFSTTATLLSGALAINPFDVPAVASAMDAALAMDAREKRDRLDRDLPYVRSRPSGKWTAEILDDMETVHKQIRVSDPDDPLALATATRLDVGTLASAFGASRSRAIFLDLGGTIIPKGDSVSKVLKAPTEDARALLRPEVRAALAVLSADPKTTVYVVSGTTIEALEALFGDLPRVGLAAASGLVQAAPAATAGARTSKVSEHGTDWAAVRAVAAPMLRRQAARTNGSAVLKRDPGLAWSYYRADPEWGRIQALQLARDLEAALAPHDVEVVHREGMIEVVPGRLHKGNVVKSVLTNLTKNGAKPDFVLTVGDSPVDEKMYSSVYSRGGRAETLLCSSRGRPALQK